jgi:hypothetical protein
VLHRPFEDGGTLLAAQRVRRAHKDILAACEKPLLGHLQSVCQWPERERNKSWCIGDFSFFVVGFSVTPKSQAYVQFWSEPDEVGVIVQVSPAVRGKKAAGVATQLRERGFDAGGPGGNFEKTFAVASARDLRALAGEATSVLCDVLGYDGRAPLIYRTHLGTRLHSQPVFDAIGPGDLAKLMLHWGFAADVDHHDDDNSLITSAIGDQPFFIAFVGEHPEGSHEYGLVELRTYFSFEGGVPDGMTNAINQNFVTVKASVDEEGDLIVQQSILVHGGVTEASLALSFGIWKETVEEIVKGLELT